MPIALQGITATLLACCHAYLPPLLNGCVGLQSGSGECLCMIHYTCSCAFLALSQKQEIDQRLPRGLLNPSCLTYFPKERRKRFGGMQPT